MVVEQPCDEGVIRSAPAAAPCAPDAGPWILAGGSLGDHFGRRRVYAVGVALFALASVWCGLAPNVTVLIVARAFQGVAGALLVPGSLAIISAAFDEER